jgi:hypothetical protein
MLLNDRYTHQIQFDKSLYNSYQCKLEGDSTDYVCIVLLCNR